MRSWKVDSLELTTDSGMHAKTSATDATCQHKVRLLQPTFAETRPYYFSRVPFICMFAEVSCQSRPITKTLVYSRSIVIWTRACGPYFTTLKRYVRLYNVLHKLIWVKTRWIQVALFESRCATFSCLLLERSSLQIRD